MPDSLARIFIITGIVLIAVRFLGHLPGDIRIERERFRVYVPLATSILLSIILTIFPNLFLRRR